MIQPHRQSHFPPLAATGLKMGEDRWSLVIDRPPITIAGGGIDTIEGTNGSEHWKMTEPFAVKVLF